MLHRPPCGTPHKMDACTHFDSYNQELVRGIKPRDLKSKDGSVINPKFISPWMIAKYNTLTTADNTTLEEEKGTLMLMPTQQQ